MMRELKEAAKISRCIVRFGVSPDEWQIDADSVCFWLDQRAVRIVGARVCDPQQSFLIRSLRQTGHVVSFHTAAARRAARLGLPAPSAFIHPRSSAKEDGSESICGSFFLSSRPAVCRLVATDGRGRR